MAPVSTTDSTSPTVTAGRSSLSPIFSSDSPRTLESDENVGEGEDRPAVTVGDVESVVEPGAYERDDESCPESYRTRDEAELCECSLVGQSGPSALGVVGLPVVS